MRLLPVLLIACATPPIQTVAPASTETGDLRGRGVVLTGDVPQWGHEVTYTVSGAEPDAAVRLGLSKTGVGDGPCPAALDGACLDIVPPLTILGSGYADLRGNASFHVALPARCEAGREAHLQAASIGYEVGLSDPLSQPIEGMPEPEDDRYAVAEDHVLRPDAGVLHNDRDCGGHEPLSALLVDDVSHGVLTLDPDGDFVYTPDVDFHGEDGFTYQALDAGGRALASVTITVESINDACVSLDDRYGTGIDTPLVARSVLANDADVDGDDLVAVLMDDVENGTLVFHADGSFTYTPDPRFVGVDSFTYACSDGRADGPVAVVTIDVG